MFRREAMQKRGTRTTQLINQINEVHGAKSNTTSADSS
jgi:predicted DNA-binding ribbon-helix-helix protein